MNALVASKAWVWCQKHRSGNVSWKVQVGTSNLGKPDIRTFTSETEATNFAADWNSRLVGRNTNGLTDLSTLQRAEVLAALAKLEAFNATLPEAVDFFLKFARPEKGKITVEEAVKLFLDSKTKLKCSAAYLRGCRKTFYGPFAKHFAGRPVADLTPTDCERYIDSHPEWSNASKHSHVSYLRGLYSWLIKKCYARLNPFASIERPRTISTRPKVISPEDVGTLLQFALDTGYKAECAAMSLVFFCGIRAEGEVQRLDWEDVDLESKTVRVSAEQSKTGQRRVNPIADCAVEWLKACKATGRIAPNDHIQRMKRLRQRCKAANRRWDYPQNAMRHCFCSYHIAEFRDSAKTAMMLGHPNASLLYKTYYELVNVQDAHRFWRVVPESVKAAWEQRAREEEGRARLLALKKQLEAQSPIL